MQESGEMYLETILVLEKEKENIRAIDIAKQMGFSKPSVSLALSKLRQEGFLKVGENQFISLTDSGRKIAETIYERHLVLTKVFTSIGVPAEIAANDACKIEHDLSEETFSAIKRFIEKMK